MICDRRPLLSRLYRRLQSFDHPRSNWLTVIKTPHYVDTGCIGFCCRCQASGFVVSRDRTSSSTTMKIVDTCHHKTVRIELMLDMAAISVGPTRESSYRAKDTHKPRLTQSVLAYHHWIDSCDMRRAAQFPGLRSIRFRTALTLSQISIHLYRMNH